ncbi:PAS domain S-box protein [Maribacter litopenaei]|uniref:PAS domain S-box protein n=1 Tax=Maribacter litopenaei TaxID=2976127 RepID=A0ABY5Y7V5_9FLAO|nr:PAS domain S-box protein [Maribacter litopenaei]UWX54936.1 PAS domain S-box protein [Maribacter litopenaei]
MISNKKNALYGLFVMGILGLFLAGLAGFFTYFIMKQPKKLQKMVNEKTLLLKESEQKFRTLIEQASDGIFLADFKGNVLDANLAGVKMFRYSKEELLEKNLRDLATKEDLNKTPIRFPN